MRNVTNEDADFIYRLFSDERVCEFLYDEEIFKCRKDDAIEFVEWNQDPERERDIKSVGISQKKVAVTKNKLELVDMIMGQNEQYCRK